MTTGQRIAAKRKELALSQEALGAELGVSRQSIYKWESDASLPEIDKLIALSRCFGVPVGWLLGVEEETPAPETLTERQLQQVEELTAQYLAAQPPQRKPSRALLAAGGALGLALVILAAVFCQRVLRLESQQTQLRSEIAQTTAEQMEDLRDQVQDILRQQRDLLAEGSGLLSDFGAAVEDVTFRTEGSAITVSAWAVPKTWREGMTAEFLLTSNGETTAVPGALGEGNRFSAPAVTAALTDDISLSVVFTLPDGSRETETLERWTGLLSASQPSYWPEGLLGRIVTFNQGILNARRCYLRVAWDDAFDSELYGPIEIVDWQVGVFQNHRLITWADTGADIPADVVKEFDDRNGGRKDYLGYRVLRIPDFRIAWREGDVLSIAIRARDQHGREFFFTENPDTSLGYYGNDPIWNYDLKDYGTSFQVLYQEDEAVTALPENWDFTPVPRLPET